MTSDKIFIFQPYYGKMMRNVMINSLIITCAVILQAAGIQCWFGNSMSGFQKYQCRSNHNLCISAKHGGVMSTGCGVGAPCQDLGKFAKGASCQYCDKDFCNEHGTKMSGNENGIGSTRSEVIISAVSPVLIAMLTMCAF